MLIWQVNNQLNWNFNDDVEEKVPPPYQMEPSTVLPPQDPSFIDGRVDNDNGGGTNDPPTILTISDLLLIPLSPLISLYASFLDKITSPTSKRILVYLIVLFGLVATSALTSVVAYGTFYWVYVPRIRTEVDIWLQYGFSRPPFSPFSLVNPSTSLPLLNPQPQSYDITLHLRYPLTPSNLNIGPFMVQLSLSDSQNHTTTQISRPASLPFRPKEGLIRSSMKSLFSPLDVFRGPKADEWTSISLVRRKPLGTTKVEGGFLEVGRRDAYILPGSRGFEEIGMRGISSGEGVGAGGMLGKELEVLEARLEFVAKLVGIRYLMYYHPIISTIFFTTSFFFLQLFSSLIGWYLFATPNMSLFNNNNNNGNEVGGGDSDFDDDDGGDGGKERGSWKRKSPTKQQQSYTFGSSWFPSSSGRQQQPRQPPPRQRRDDYEADLAEAMRLRKMERKAILRQEMRRRDRDGGGGLVKKEEEDMNQQPSAGLSDAADRRDSAAAGFVPRSPGSSNNGEKSVGSWEDVGSEGEKVNKERSEEEEDNSGRKGKERAYTGHQRPSLSSSFWGGLKKKVKKDSDEGGEEEEENENENDEGQEEGGNGRSTSTLRPGSSSAVPTRTTPTQRTGTGRFTDD